MVALFKISRTCICLNLSWSKWLHCEVLKDDDKHFCLLPWIWTKPSTWFRLMSCLILSVSGKNGCQYHARMAWITTETSNVYERSASCKCSTLLYIYTTMASFPKFPSIWSLSIRVKLSFLFQGYTHVFEMQIIPIDCNNGFIKTVLSHRTYMLFALHGYETDIMQDFSSRTWSISRSYVSLCVLIITLRIILLQISHKCILYE